MIKQMKQISQLRYARIDAFYFSRRLWLMHTMLFTCDFRQTNMCESCFNFGRYQYNYHFLSSPSSAIFRFFFSFVQTIDSSGIELELEALWMIENAHLMQPNYHCRIFVQASGSHIRPESIISAYDKLQSRRRLLLLSFESQFYYRII